MENEIILTAKTVEEAMAEARSKYGDTDHELSFTILEMPKKGFLGIGTSPAKVKVTITKSLPDADLSDLVAGIRSMKMEEAVPEKKPQPPKHNRDQKPQQNPPKKSEDELPAALRTPVKKNDAQKKQGQNKKQKQPRPADSRGADEKKNDLLSAVKGIKDAPAASTAKENFVVRAKGSFEKIEDKLDDIGDKIEDTFDSLGDKIEKKIESVKTKKEEKIREEKPRIEFVTPAEMQFAIDFANTLLANMNLPAKAVHNPDAKGEAIPEGLVAARIEIEGDDSGILIGHHGETLDAIQYLVNLCASRKSESAKKEFVKIVVDIEGYREKREETLRALARRMAAKAIKNRRNVVLEPMNPYERRIIHSEVQGIENVSTHSVGSDENRKIVIVYEGEDKIVKKSRSGKRRSGKGKGERAEKPVKKDVPLSAESAENIENYKRTAAEYPRQKPVRAKSIDDIRLDLSEDSTLTLGAIGVSSDKDDDKEESLREY